MRRVALLEAHAARLDEPIHVGRRDFVERGLGAHLVGLEEEEVGAARRRGGGGGGGLARRCGCEGGQEEVVLRGRRREECEKTHCGCVLAAPDRA